MIEIFALALSLSTAEPHRAEGVDEPVPHRQCVERHLRACADGGEARPIVRLDASFFQGGLVGGVERPSATRLYGRQTVVIIGPAGRSHVNVSAGAQAAARASASASVQVTASAGH